MFKDFLDYKDPKKGYIVNDSQGNPTILNTGFHRYKNVYNFYNNAKEGQIGAVKSIVNQNNNILWTPNQGNKVEINFTQTSSTITTNPDIFLPEDVYIDYDYYQDFTLTGEGYQAGYGICGGCSYPDFTNVPVAIQILSYNLNGKIPFIYVGQARSITYGYNGYCPSYNSYIPVSYMDLFYYIKVSVGYVPTPLYLVHYNDQTPLTCMLITPTPGSITFNYLDWEDFCRLGFTSVDLRLEVFKLVCYGNGCVLGCHILSTCINTGIWVWRYTSLVSGEYVKVRLYFKKIKKICIT